MTLYVLIGIYMLASIPVWLTPIAALKDWVLGALRSTKPEVAPVAVRTPAEARPLVAVS